MATRTRKKKQADETKPPADETKTPKDETTAGDGAQGPDAVESKPETAKTPIHPKGANGDAPPTIGAAVDQVLAQATIVNGTSFPNLPPDNPVRLAEWDAKYRPLLARCRADVDDCEKKHE